MIGRLFRNLLLPGLILAAGVGVFAGLVASKEPPQRQQRDRQVPRVEVVPVSAAPAGGFAIEVNGTAVPKREASLSAEVAGRVVERTEACWAGRAVKRGDLLLKLDPRPLEIQIETYQAELAQVAADLEQLDTEIGNTEELVSLAEQEVDLRRREQLRVEQLISRNAASASDRDAADAQVLTSRQNLQRLQNDRRMFASRRARLEAQRRRILATLDQATYDLERAVISSPVDGRIVEVLVEQDSYCRPGDPLLTIEDTSTMEVRCSLQLEDLYWLAGGDDPLDHAGDDPYSIPRAGAEISHAIAGRESTWEGVLSRFEGGGIDERTRTVPCRVEVPAPDGLRRGMFVSVTFRGIDPRIPLLSIPRSAFRPNDEIWLVEGGRLAIHRVEPVRVLEDSVIVRGDGPGDPIPPGASLVVSPLDAPVAGMEVAIAGEVPAAPVASADPGSERR
ncbi:efflux RND transporter periplasmic adaptor subunit [Tautonia plasticadhaerens]|uniref:Multidrug resistance protein MdtN n=1 Tax=Tautonia plasticadhaerens TaxID=2527974 RepID=A0A518H306_9BACT|nr:HlyD family efflux transporter periplasmic adaptor subunit [Tautonia plasticadhaerens]QDV35215.1 Multidrug resistance protein MdtN [Tautonia plasticadhaerens]